MKPDFLPDLDTAKRLVLELGHLGVLLGTHGRRVTYDAPKGVLTEETKDLLRVNRHLIHSLLTQEKERGAIGEATTIPLPSKSAGQRLHCPYPNHVDWLSIHGARICRICHPPVVPCVVKETLP